MLMKLTLYCKKSLRYLTSNPQFSNVWLSQVWLSQVWHFHVRLSRVQPFHVWLSRAQVSRVRSFSWLTYSYSNFSSLGLPVFFVPSYKCIYTCDICSSRSSSEPSLLHNNLSVTLWIITLDVSFSCLQLLCQSFFLISLLLDVKLVLFCLLQSVSRI